MSKIEHYEVKDGTLIRKAKTCPKCGDGVFMGEHSNRTSCGKCGYTEFKKTEKPKKEKVKTEKPPAPDTGAPSLLED